MVAQTLNGFGKMVVIQNRYPGHQVSLMNLAPKTVVWQLALVLTTKIAVCLSNVNAGHHAMQDTKQTSHHQVTGAQHALLGTTHLVEPIPHVWKWYVHRDSRLVKHQVRHLLLTGAQHVQLGSSPKGWHLQHVRWRVISVLCRLGFQRWAWGNHRRVYWTKVVLNVKVKMIKVKLTWKQWLIITLTLTLTSTFNSIKASKPSPPVANSPAPSSKKAN